jgi:hypothetical protein
MDLHSSKRWPFSRSDRKIELAASQPPPDWVMEIVELLEAEPEQRWHAIESFALLDQEDRSAILEAFASYETRPAVEAFSRLLATLRMPTGGAPTRLATKLERGAGTVVRPATVPGIACRSPFRLAASAVTPVDGDGRGSILISVERDGQRRTAAFLCDVMRGIVGVAGSVEPISERAGGLFDDILGENAAESISNVTELAIGLLAGSLVLTNDVCVPGVREWLDGLFGPEFHGATLPAGVSGFDPAWITADEIPERARLVLETCPSWLDRSVLTFELAEEILLREGRPGVDPDRDRGAYRYLFEHRILERLELYRRMLLWMVRIWHCAGRDDLWQSALVLAYQLSDEQYAVPSYPFTVWLTTRSLLAAQMRS